MTNDFALAKALAERFHQGQMYGKHPYMYHLEMVANSVSEESDERLATVAILHDILEDTSCTEGLLYSLFEDNIVKAVIALSKISTGTGYGSVIIDEPYEEYIARVKNNSLAKIVKMHDTLCNLKESLVRRDMNRVRKYSKQMNLLGE